MLQNQHQSTEGMSLIHIEAAQQTKSSFIPWQRSVYMMPSDVPATESHRSWCCESETLCPRHRGLLEVNLTPKH